MVGRYTHHEHTADITLHLYGDTYADLLRIALQGMFSLMKPVKRAGVVDRSKRHFTIVGNDAEMLLVSFLSEALCMAAIHHEWYDDVIFERIDKAMICGVYTGYPLSRYAGVEIKAVTFYNLRVTHSETGFEAMITFDI